MKLNNLTTAQKIVITVWLVFSTIALFSSWSYDYERFISFLVITTIAFILFKVWAKKEAN